MSQANNREENTEGVLFQLEKFKYKQTHTDTHVVKEPPTSMSITHCSQWLNPGRGREGESLSMKEQKIKVVQN